MKNVAFIQLVILVRATCISSSFGMGSTVENLKGRVKDSRIPGYDADNLHILQSAALSM